MGGALRLDTLEKLPVRRLEQAAEVLVEAFRHSPSVWSELESAREEVTTFLRPERIAFVAIEDEIVAGWIGAIKHSAELWELHPLAVRPHAQGRGIGRTFVETLEERARREEVCTIWLGTDDDFGGTNLFGKHLYPNVLDRVQELRVVSRHPFAFFKKMAFVVVGVIPDASGIGKHDILMAKQVKSLRKEE